MLPQLQQATALLVAQTPPAGGCGGGPMDLFPFAAMMLILYFVWLRPASRERKQHQAMIESLKRGDEIVTNSGILGTIADMQETVVTLEVAKNVKIRVLRSTIAKRVGDLASGDKKAADEKDAKASKSKG